MIRFRSQKTFYESVIMVFFNNYPLCCLCNVRAASKNIREVGRQREKILTGNPRRTLRRSQPETRNPQSKAGFTLLEIMVAISIIAIVLVTVFRMHAQTLSMNYSARFYATSPLLAQKKMVEIESKGQRGYRQTIQAISGMNSQVIAGKLPWMMLNRKHLAVSLKILKKLIFS